MSHRIFGDPFMLWRLPEPPECSTLLTSKSLGLPQDLDHPLFLHSSSKAGVARPSPVMTHSSQVFHPTRETAFTWDPTSLGESIFCLARQKTRLDFVPVGLGLHTPVLKQCAPPQMVRIYISKSLCGLWKKAAPSKNHIFFSLNVQQHNVESTF